MIFTVCALCKDSVMVSNCSNGICRICWSKIEDGDESVLNAYIKHDVLLEAFPNQSKKRSPFKF